MHELPDAHTMPQPPQLFGSVRSLTHAAPHCENPGLHAKLHILPTQVGRPLVTPGQMFPHAPQFVGSVIVVVQPDGQHICPGKHGGPKPQPPGRHIPPLHVDPGAHALPHMPQLRGSLVVSLQPVAQQLWPGPQIGPPAHPIAMQLPPTHALPGAHTRVH